MPKTSTAEHFALAALDTVSSSLAFLDERGGILSTNMPWQEFGRANGGSAAQAAGAENYLTICDQATGAGSEGAQAMAQGIRAVIQGRQGRFELEYPCNSPTEKRFFIARVSRFEFENQVRVVVTHEDISRRQMLEEALAAKSQAMEQCAAELVIANAFTDKYLYRMLLGAIPFSLLFIDTSLRVLSANRNFLEKSHRTEENTLGKRIRDIFPEVIMEFTQLENKVRTVIETGITLPGSHMTYRAPGIPVRVYFYTVIPIKSSNVVVRAMLVMDDVTEKLALSAKASLAERHLASVVESANDLVISTDRHGRITSWNKAAERITGFSNADVSGRLLTNLCEVVEDRNMASLIQQQVNGGAVELCERNLVARSGTLIPVDWSFSPIPDENGKAIGVVVVGRDLSERRALEQHLYQTEKLAALGVMAGGIAHELRNPLSVSFSAAQFLLDPPDKPEFHQECVKKILEGIERSSVIIENLLRFARPSSSNQAESLNLVDLVRETVNVLTPQAKVLKINLVQEYAEPVVPLVGNANLLQQVIMNLVLNAYHAMPQGGDIHLAVRREADMALVSVRDAGCGIAPADMGRLFDPFFTTRPSGQGTGLGLSICHTIVKQHRGTLVVESNLGQGSLFVVRLPLVLET